MAIVKMKPTSAGRRGMARVVTGGLRKSVSYTPLLEKKNSTAGRNNSGRTTTRHRGGGHKHHYRAVDFKRNEDSISAKVEYIEYDPNHTAFIILLCYAGGRCHCIIASRGTQAGAVLAPGTEAIIRVGNTLPIRNIPVGIAIHCIEMKPGKGTQAARSVGASTVLLAKEGTYVQVHLRSDEVREISINCCVTIGEVSNEEQSLKKIGKTSANRWRGIRPTVRGAVMNPVDHPHGGGEGRTGKARKPVNPWDTPAKGYHIHNSKRTDNMIVCRRYSNKS